MLRAGLERSEGLSQKDPKCRSIQLMTIIAPYPVGVRPHSPARLPLEPPAPGRHNGAMVRYRAGRARSVEWHTESIRALRRHLGLTQQQLAQELGIRQQTVSEWETGLYAPRGASARLLSLVAERAGFAYSAHPGEAPPTP